MKRIASIILATIFCLMLIVPASALENGVTPRYSNTCTTSSDFYISSDGKADICLSYIGYQGVTTGATITSKIQKKTIIKNWLP